MTNGLLAVNSLLLYLPLFLLLSHLIVPHCFYLFFSLSLNGRFASSFVAGTTVLVVSPFFVLFIKSVKVDVPVLAIALFAVVPIDSSD
jgi:hypothetical protein